MVQIIQELQRFPTFRCNLVVPYSKVQISKANVIVDRRFGATLFLDL